MTEASVREAGDGAAFDANAFSDPASRRAETNASPPVARPDEQVPRPLARRVLLAFGFAFAVSAMTSLFAVGALRRAGRDTERLATGFVPVALELARLRATQSSIATLVDGIPDDRDPLAERRLLEALAAARAGQVRSCRKSLEALSLSGSDAPANEAVNGFRDRLEEAARLFADDDGKFATLEGTGERIDRLVIDLGGREHDASKKLASLQNDVTKTITATATEQREADGRMLGGLVLLSFASALAAWFVGRRLQVLLAPVARLEARARAVARGDLEPRAVDPGPDELGRLEAAFETMVTGLAAARERAVAAERFAAIGKMAAHVTHEIRNPLSAIGLNLDLLQEDLAESGDVGERSTLVKAIAREVARLEALSEEYLRMARLPTPRRDGDDLVGVVEDVVAFCEPEMARAQCTVTVIVEPDASPSGPSPGGPKLLFDEAQIRQALANLLRNAREAMPHGGPITVTVAREGLAVTVTVADQGEGVPEALRASIFEAFFSTKGNGTGLGLAITRQIVRGHGGDLLCLAAAGDSKGARFRMILPLSPARDAADEAGLL